MVTTARAVRHRVAARSIVRELGRGLKDPWRVGPAAIACCVLVPILCLPWLALFPEENIWPHLFRTVLPNYVMSTLELMIGVGVGTLLLGVSTAWIVTMYHFPGVRVFAWALLLPLAMPAYVVAYVYTDLLEFAGPVQSALRAAFAWNSVKDYWFPEIRSLGGAVVVMTFVLYPYVYLLARSAFLEQSVASLEASRTLGCAPWRAWWRVALPSARPAIAVGVALVLMETLNDFGTVDFFGVASMTTGIYDVWLNMGNLGGAAQIASVMLVFVVALIMVERSSRRRQRHFGSHPGRRSVHRVALVGWHRGAAVSLCTVTVAVGFLLPLSVLAWYSVRNFKQAWTDEFVGYAINSFVLASGAAITTLVLGMGLAYAVRLRAGAWSQAVSRIASLGYAVPGAVLAIGVIVPLAAFDNALDGYLRQNWGVSTGLLLSGTAFTIGFAYVVRFLAVAAGGIEASLGKVTPSMDMAARTLGVGPGKTFVRVHLPLIRSGMLGAATLVFVDCMKELPATLILRPFNFDTLATHLYQFASDEQIELAALGALTIVAVGLAPVVLLSGTMGAGRARVPEK
ncbi:MAG: iron(III) transport system permease protein [Gammaproteobacteria bacterium]|jgi:iron(III) transport system permease protein